MDYGEALARLEARQETRIALGLERMREHLARLGDPHKRYPSFHVAGTNGKGSTCAMLESVLRAAGYRTGLYISPHLFEPRERVQSRGRWIPRPDFARLLERALAADPRSELTYFELTTSIAFQWFAEKKVDVAVLETGLGGRLDATNVVERPLAALITSIDYDHMHFLGDTLAKIAAEKAGIIKAGCPVVCAELRPAALAAVRRRADRLQAPLAVVRKPFPSRRVDWSRGRQIVAAGGPATISLLGDRQGLNAALVKTALDAAADRLPVGRTAFLQGLSSVRWPGRFEVVPLRGGRRAVLDGAHNPEAARTLARTWAASPWSKRPSRWIFGLMKDKDAAGVLAVLRPYLSETVVVRPPSPRAMDPLELAGLVRKAAPRARVIVEPDGARALRSWRTHPGPATAVVCGSFYLVGQAAKALKGAAHG